MIIHFALSPRPHKMNRNSLPLKPKNFVKMLHKYKNALLAMSAKHLKLLII